VIAVVLTVSKSFSLPPIIPSNLFAASRSASGNAGAIITGADNPNAAPSRPASEGGILHDEAQAARLQCLLLPMIRPVRSGDETGYGNVG